MFACDVHREFVLIERSVAHTTYGPHWHSNLPHESYIEVRFDWSSTETQSISPKLFPLPMGCNICRYHFSLGPRTSNAPVGGLGSEGGGRCAWPGTAWRIQWFLCSAPPVCSYRREGRARRSPYFHTSALQGRHREWTRIVPKTGKTPNISPVCSSSIAFLGLGLLFVLPIILSTSATRQTDGQKYRHGKKWRTDKPKDKVKEKEVVQMWSLPIRWPLINRSRQILHLSGPCKGGSLAGHGWSWRCQPSSVSWPDRSWRQWRCKSPYGQHQRYNSRAEWTRGLTVSCDKNSDDHDDDDDDNDEDDDDDDGGGDDYYDE